MPEPASSHLCACHGEPCYWHKMPARKNGGIWRCAVRKRELQNADWHTPNGGYVRRRRRNLAGQRSRILEQLDQLAQEATNVES